MIEPKDRIIFALDVPSLDQASHYVKLLAPHIGMFKVGLELFAAEGPSVVKEVLNAGNRVFLDLKLHDIPKTVERAMSVLAGLGVSLATVHTTGGPDMLNAAVEGAQGKLGVMGVTVLTSEGGNPQTISDRVLRRAETAKAAGCAGVVCSGLEAAKVRQAVGEDFFIVTPGIRMADDNSKDDQKRVVTPGLAVQSGASHIVVGRPIRDAADPIQAAKAMALDIEKAG
ncbi:orotidine-5'-phosphate decarboxylase [Desulfatibacillum alkenivorans DSM 16219]|jgi:orotidine-5'-phosphate decarboxylase|uniref:Orotidine 5'-phosphate decarboxylase n=1 Tax=Desulfatibacillum alkenivorans DSM 16219 TaxID=1121393 RepID=A0A1M6URE1_9BACT|nr:orotidine-5'-phosphate decarboxylase [Desulfatibacillum alkenivorans]SHK71755.1 orotidine-5'-phosphate decarboxylase [Desulfatibacillum alkenivorans DSM 16219]